ncbi:hypothetical protein DL96DRAFT_1618520 [Flagelloscypha sp. PMI_526]|nr:hypothetical protein DL96DRAFT_1618520 [Flagelloscypha sp. PMI_526]
MLHVHVDVHLTPKSPDTLSRFLHILQTTCYPHIIAEPNCMAFDVIVQKEEGLVRLVEIWDCSLDWFMTNQTTKSYYKEYLDQVEPLFVKPRDARVFERASDEFGVVRSGTFKVIE